MADSEKNVYSSHLEIYEDLVKHLKKVERKGDTMPYTSLNGNMFSYLDKTGNIALRLSKSDIVEFMEKYNATLMNAYGIVQKEYVKIPDNLLGKKAVLYEFFEKSFEYAKNLKPKPTKKKQK
jgi:hypothetical protein